MLIFIFLDNADKPVCQDIRPHSIGVAKGDEVEIECRIDANPNPGSYR